MNAIHALRQPKFRGTVLSHKNASPTKKVPSSIAYSQVTGVQNEKQEQLFIPNQQEFVEEVLDRVMVDSDLNLSPQLARSRLPTQTKHEYRTAGAKQEGSVASQSHQSKFHSQRHSMKNLGPHQQDQVITSSLYTTFTHE